MMELDCFPKRNRVTKKNGIHSAPYYVHERILSYFSLKDRFKSFAPVCKYWYKLAKTLPLEYLVDLEEFGCFPSQNEILCSQICSLVRRLIIHDGFLSVSKKSQCLLFPCFQNLRVLIACLFDDCNEDANREDTASLHFVAFSLAVETRRYGLEKLCIPFLYLDQNVSDSLCCHDTEVFFKRRTFPDLKLLEFLLTNVRTKEEKAKFLSFVENMPRACPKLQKLGLYFTDDEIDYEYDVSTLVLTIQDKYKELFHTYHRVEWENIGYFRTNLIAVKVDN